VAFNNIRKIFRVASAGSALKLLLLLGSQSRPRYRSALVGLLKPFSKDGSVDIHYRCHGRSLTCYVRLTDLSSDVRSVLDVVLQDTYSLDPKFRPDLVIDGGANIGLFTLHIAATASGPVKIVACEPLPRNLDLLRKHLEVNHVPAEIVAGCLGGDRVAVPFYCRGAIDSSFSPDKPFDSVLEMPVYALEDVIGATQAERILIKLDIEGMELAVLRPFVEVEHRPVYVVGELHGFEANDASFRKIFSDRGWGFKYLEVSDDAATFKACSPAALSIVSLN
jgi:FkbM family methyltransferase